MGLVDVFSAEDRVQIKFSDLYALMEAAAQADAKERLIENAVKCDVPHAHIRCMLTGENDELTAYRNTGFTPKEVVELNTCVSETREKLADTCKQLTAARAEARELRKQATQTMGADMMAHGRAE